MTMDQDPKGYDPYTSNATAVCGTLNTETGEFKEGRQDKKGNLTYHNPLPWWRRLLGQKEIHSLWGEWEYLASGEGKQTRLESGLFSSAKYQEWGTEIHVYRQRHLCTGENRYRVKTTSGLAMEIDAVVYEKTGKVVTL